MKLRVFLPYLAPLAVIAGLELIARAAWDNPYDLRNQPLWNDSDTGAQQFRRMHTPGIDLRVDASGLYPDAGKVRAVITAREALSSGDVQKDATATDLAFGGSTTECGLVPEGQRWPDLLPRPTRNYGVSGNTSAESLRNLLYMLDREGSAIRRVYLMHAYNDVLTLLRHGSGDSFDFRTPYVGPIDLLERERPAVLLGMDASRSRLLSLLNFTAHDLFGRSYLAVYQRQLAQQQDLATMSADTAQLVEEALRARLLPQRAAVYRDFVTAARGHDVEVVLMTQPHAYREDYRPFGEDLRTYFQLGDQKATLEQAARWLHLTNEQTRQLATTLEVQLIDLEKAFAAEDPSTLFYDQVHYTPAGARLVVRQFED